MAKPAISSTLAQRQFNHLSNILFSFKFHSLMILAHMLYERFDVTAYCYVVVRS